MTSSDAASRHLTGLAATRQPPGSAPSRASEAPSRDPPAKYAFIAPIVSSTATTAVTTRACSPSAMAMRSESGAWLRPVAGPSTRTLVVARPR